MLTFDQRAVDWTPELIPVQCNSVWQEVFEQKWSETICQESDRSRATTKDNIPKKNTHIPKSQTHSQLLSHHAPPVFPPTRHPTPHHSLSNNPYFYSHQPSYAYPNGSNNGLRMPMQKNNRVPPSLWNQNGNSSNQINTTGKQRRDKIRSHGIPPHFVELIKVLHGYISYK